VTLSMIRLILSPSPLYVYEAATLLIAALVSRSAASQAKLSSPRLVRLPLSS